MIRVDGKITSAENVTEKLVEKSGKSPFQLSLDAGMNKNQVKRFLNGKSPTIKQLEMMLNTIGYQIEITPMNRTYGRCF